MRINSDARRCVVFFGKASPRNGEIRYGGTGFLLCDRDRENVPYLITCRHVANLLEGGFFVRVNKRNGSSVALEFGDVKWSFHPDPSVDVAATVFPLSMHTYDVVYFNLKLIERYAPERVMCGDPVSLVGLFRLHAGSRRNVPLVHTGNLAALPDPYEKIPIRDRTTNQVIEVEAYLVEAQTLEGLSGSPVFIQRFIQIPGLKTAQGGDALAYGDRLILGLYQGAWDGEPGAVLAADRNLQGPGHRVPVGMGIVVPGERILELIDDDPDFKSTREDVRRERLRSSAASSDASFPLASGNANHAYGEDFSTILNAATQKRERKE